MALPRRPLRRPDVSAWARLLAVVSDADGDLADAGENRLLDSFDDPDRDHERGSLGIFDGPVLAGYGVLAARSAAEPVHDMRYEGAVHPAYRGRGLGGELLSWAEKAAVPLHEERFPGHPLNLGSGCVSTNEDATALHKERGYRLGRIFLTMVRDLSAPVAEMSLADGLRVAEFTPEVSEDARFVRNEAFRDHWGSVVTSREKWAHMLRSGTFRPVYSFVVYSGSEPLAILLCHQHGPDLHIALVATRARGRKRGIATALLTRAMARARADGFGSASLHVDADSRTGAVGVYERAGLAARVSWTVYQKDLLR